VGSVKPDAGRSPTADAIVVLGCRILASGRPSAPASRRAARAAEAFRQGVAPLVVLSGGRRWGALVEARALGRELVREGVPAGAIVEELWSLNTYENAVFSAALLRRKGARRVAVVTCPWHLDRALRDFRLVGIEAWGLPALDVPAGAPWRLFRWAKEAVCGLLDVRGIRRAEALLGGGVLGPEPS
jgi:uncharacterized SAM-binding protein YcdF (DUF218 family)